MDFIYFSTHQTSLTGRVGRKVRPVRDVWWVEKRTMVVLRSSGTPGELSNNAESIRLTNFRVKSDYTCLISIYNAMN